MARNSVAANILMVVLLVGGALKIKSIKQEVFPEFDLDLILIQVPYPGASPSEVEQGVSLALEEAVRSLDGVEEVRTTNSEGMATVAVELLLGTDPEEALNDIKASVDRITSFPEDIEKPTIFRASNRFEVISLVIHGDLDERTLRALAEKARDELLQQDGITYVELFGVRPLEVSVEISQENLRRYGLTLDQVAAVIRSSSVEVPGGGVKTAAGEVLLRTSERRRGSEFGEITVLSMPDGTQVRVSDIANVKDGFAETDQEATFNGQRAVMVKVFRSGDQTPIDVSNSVKNYIATHRNTFPPGVELATWLDMSEFYSQRIDLLLRNAAIGLALVLLVLGLFLEMRLAFWVTIGIPVSFVGALLFLPSADVSLNMISLFAFILVLGMVVDDAIIVGEEIYKRRQEGMPFMQAAVFGVRHVATPVCFAIITTIIFYLPMLFVPGPPGKFFRVIPIVVIFALIISLVESLLILPAHLGHGKKTSSHGLFGFIHRQQQKVSRALEWFIETFYVPSVRFAARRRYVVFAIGLATLIGSVGVIAGGRIGRTFMPAVENDVIQAQVTLPYGSSVERTIEVKNLMERNAQAILAENGGDSITRGIFAQVAGLSANPGDPMGFSVSAGSHIAEVNVFLVESGKRAMTSTQFAQKWRESLKNVAGIEKMAFRYTTGIGSGPALSLRLSHTDLGVLERAAADLARQLQGFDGTSDVDDGFEAGKEQLDFNLKPEARSLGVTELDLARQLRASFFGSEAVRQQRGREEVRVYVRLPREERESEYNVENLKIRTPKGGEIPLSQAATITRGRAYTSISRINGRRTVTVSADVDPSQGNAAEILESLKKDILPNLVSDYAGLTWQTGGQQQDMADTNKSLASGFMFALIVALALLAVAFRSYVQPLIVILAIPFGFVGALWGHVVMGFDLSMMSWMGVVALAGVVVNDSLILVVAVNRYKDEGMTTADAVVAGGVRRFRPILLTSLTTFFGLAPMILETSVQAKFLVPMAISLGFGVIFATFITLMIVPSAYVIIDDLKAIFSKTYEASKVMITGRHPTISKREIELASLPDAKAEFLDDEEG
jgi:multidrug efflux pump subunit AcrB